MGGVFGGWFGALCYMVLGFMKEIIFTIFGQKNFSLSNDRLGFIIFLVQPCQGGYRKVSERYFTLGSSAGAVWLPLALSFARLSFSFGRALGWFLDGFGKPSDDFWTALDSLLMTLVDFGYL